MMTTEPILCSGNDLAGVCDDIRARGGVVESMDAGGSLGNAGYRVNYFERVEKSRDSQCTVSPCPAATPVAVTKRECGMKSPAALINFDGGKTIAPKTPSGAEDSAQTNGGEAQRTHPQDCTAVISVGPGREARNVESAPRTPEMGSNPMPTANYDRVTEEPQSVLGSAQNAGHAGPASVPHFEPIPTGDILPQVKGGGLNADQQPLQSVPRACLGISIEDRMAALQARLAASGKLRGSRTKTPTRETRLPYRD